MTAIRRCFVVSLADDVERRRHMTSLLAGHGIEFEFWDAVPGSRLDLTTTEAEGLVKPLFLRGKAPEWALRNKLGCALSHLRLAKCLLGSRTPALVLEDDVRLADDFRQQAHQLVGRSPVDTDILYVGYSHEPEGGERLDEGLRAALAPRGTFGYVLWESGARKLAEGLLPMELPIDEVLARWIRRKKLTALVADPPLVLHSGELASRIYQRPSPASWKPPVITTRKRE